MTTKKDANGTMNCSMSKPCAMLGAGKLTAALWKTSHAFRGSQYGFNVFQMDEDDGLVSQRFTAWDVPDLAKLARDIKASGDVKYYVCSSSLAICGLKKEDLIPEIDEVRGLPSFLMEDMATADTVLTF